jgi:hypothetical protein
VSFFHSSSLLSSSAHLPLIFDDSSLIGGGYEVVVGVAVAVAVVDNVVAFVEDIAVACLVPIKEDVLVDELIAADLFD